jgi:hypothetical protein
MRKKKWSEEKGEKEQEGEKRKGARFKRRDETGKREKRVKWKDERSERRKNGVKIDRGKGSGERGMGE